MAEVFPVFISSPRCSSLAVVALAFERRRLSSRIGRAESFARSGPSPSFRFQPIPSCPPTYATARPLACKFSFLEVCKDINQAGGREERKKGRRSCFDRAHLPTSIFSFAMWSLLLLPLLSLLPLVNAHGFITSHKTRMVRSACSLLLPARGRESRDELARVPSLFSLPLTCLSFPSSLSVLSTSSLERLRRPYVGRSLTLTGMARGTETVSSLCNIPFLPTLTTPHLLSSLRQTSTDLSSLEIHLLSADGLFSISACLVSKTDSSG